MIERIEQFIKNQKISVRSFEQKILASDGMIRRAINNKTDIQSKWLVIIAENYPQLNLDWLITGKGTMLRSDQPQSRPKDSPVVAPTINQEYKGAPYYNVDFIGGFDIVSNDQTQNPDYYINYPPFNKDNVVWCNLTGHSMEPELSNGDIIALKEMKTPIQYLPAGEIYGIVTDEYRTVKRVRKGDHDGFIKLVPSNKSDEFCEQEIPVEMVIKVFAVLGSMRKFF
ncbi:S24 family peptidase [Phocaeicola faecalis]